MEALLSDGSDLVAEESVDWDGNLHHYMPSFCYFTKLKTHNYAGAVFGQSPALACKLAVAVASAQPH